MACTVERLRQAARNVPVVLLLGRLKNSAWVGSIPPVLLALPRATSAQAKAAEKTAKNALYKQKSRLKKKK